jgi:hypothetical protein
VPSHLPACLFACPGSHGWSGQRQTGGRQDVCSITVMWDPCLQRCQLCVCVRGEGSGPYMTSFQRWSVLLHCIAGESMPISGLAAFAVYLHVDKASPSSHTFELCTWCHATGVASSDVLVSCCFSAPAQTCICYLVLLTCYRTFGYRTQNPFCGGFRGVVV